MGLTVALAALAIAIGAARFWWVRASEQRDRRQLRAQEIAEAQAKLDALERSHALQLERERVEWELRPLMTLSVEEHAAAAAVMEAMARVMPGLPQLPQLPGLPRRPSYNLEVPNIRAFKAASHINAGDLVSLNTDGTVERSRSTESPLGVCMGEAIPGSVVPVNLDGAATRRTMSAFGPIKTGEALCSVRDDWVTSAKSRPPGSIVVGIAESDAPDGGGVVVTLLTNGLRRAGAQVARLVLDETAKSEVAFGFWKRALAPDYTAHEKQIMPQLVEAMARDEIDASEGEAIMARYGYKPEMVEGFVKGSNVESARYVLDALVLVTKAGQQMRVDRDLALMRSGGLDSPMRQLIEGRAGHLTKAADDAFGEAEELLK